MLIMNSNELKIYMDREMKTVAQFYNLVRLMAIFTAYYYLIKMRVSEISSLITFSDSIADWIDAAVLIGTFLLELIMLFLIHRFMIRPCRLKFMKAVRIPNSYYSYKIVPARKGKGECLTVCYKKRGYIMYKNFFCIRKKGKYRTPFGLYWFEFANGYEKEEILEEKLKEDVVAEVSNDGSIAETVVDNEFKQLTETVESIKNNNNYQEKGESDNG